MVYELIHYKRSQCFSTQLAEYSVICDFHPCFPLFTIHLCSRHSCLIYSHCVPAYESCLISFCTHVYIQRVDKWIMKPNALYGAQGVSFDDRNDANHMLWPMQSPVLNTNGGFGIWNGFWTDNALHNHHHLLIFHQLHPLNPSVSPSFPCTQHLLLSLSLPDQIPSFSSSSCPSSQNSHHHGHWHHKAGHPAPPTLPADHGMSRQPNDKRGSSGCKHSSLPSGDKVRKW